MKKILFNLIAILTLQPIAAMESSHAKRARIDSSNEESSDQDEQAHLQPVLERARDIVPYPRPPALPLAPELAQLRQVQIALQRAEERRIKEEQDNSPLHSAAANGDCKLIEQLLQNGADLHERNNFARSPYYFLPNANAFDVAVKLNQESACRLLISHGAQPTDRHLYVAAHDGHVDICKFLIEYGINVDARYDGAAGTLFTPLMGAVDCGQYYVCKLLLAHGADIHAQDSEGQFPLFIAIYNNLADICQLLIEHGANIHACRDGTSMLRHAAVNDHAQICKLLLMHGANPNDQSDGEMPILIDCIANIATERAYNCAKVLLEYGAEVNMLSTGKPINYTSNAQNLGSTALMEAAYHGEFPLCELLLQWGADSEFQNNHGGTALSYATHGRFDRNEIALDPEEEDESDSGAIITLLRDPAKIRAIIMRADNPQLQRKFGRYSSICHALAQRELACPSSFDKLRMNGWRSRGKK